MQHDGIASFQLPGFLRLTWFCKWASYASQVLLYTQTFWNKLRSLDDVVFKNEPIWVRDFISLASRVRGAVVGRWRWEVAIVGFVYVSVGISVLADKTCWIKVEVALCR